MNKIRKKRIVATVWIVMGLFSMVLGVMGFAGKGITPNEARHGVVFVYTEFTDGQYLYSGTGTGWAIGIPGKPVEYIVTNGHVVQNAYLTGGVMQVYFSLAENDYMVPQVVYYSAPEEKDIAILRLPSPTDKRTALQLRESNSIEIGETAVALGYPSVANSTSYRAFDEEDITMTQGIISRRAQPVGSQYEAFQMDVSISAGNSGGPLVDQKGNVIGINTSGIYNTESGASVNYAIMIDELIRVLDNEQIDYALANSGLLWVPNWMGYMFLPIGILFLLCGGILFLKTMNGTARQLIAGKKGPREKIHPVLRGLSGPFAGQVFDLSKGTIVMGRDPATCHIVFEKNMPGISGRHCQVSYQAADDSFVLADLGSGFGTYLDHGKKLPAQVPEKLMAGDGFYLCDTNVRVIVTKE